MRIPIRYEIDISYDWDYIKEEAIEMGWLEDMVQVKKYRDMMGEYYWVIEPFEENCHCPYLVEKPNVKRII